VFKFHDQSGALYHSGAMAYIFITHVLGLAGLFHDHLLVNLVAMLCLAHSMIIAGYMLHECGHNTVFRDNRDNARLGTLLTWICGVPYTTYEDIRYKHFRHHVDNDDVMWFDYEKYLIDRPGLLRLVKFLEWFYIPAHDLLMHAVTAASAFLIPQRSGQRRRTTVNILIRLGMFMTICFFSLKAAVLYMIAYIMMMTVLRFMDSLQHDYPYRLNLYTDEVSPHKGDLAWEQVHTFSPVISWRYEWPNWLVLNFGYHNAHHAKPTTPWFRLPALHRQLFGDDPGRVIPLTSQLKMFHRYRVDRILHDGNEALDVEGEEFLQAARQAQVDGGNAASFLTTV